MKRSWYWVLLIFAGSMLVGHALQYYITGEPDRNAPDHNWLVIGESALGLLIIVFGLYKQAKANRTAADEIVLKLDDK